MLEAPAKVLTKRREIAMRLATDTTTMFVAPSNVVAMPPLAETYLTRFETQAGSHAASTLPPWFSVDLIPDEDTVAKLRQDHVRLERVAGPPIGCFEIWRQGRGRLVIYATGEPDDQWADHCEIGRCRSLPEAFRIVSKDIDATLASWGVTVTPIG